LISGRDRIAAKFVKESGASPAGAMAGLSNARSTGMAENLVAWLMMSMLAKRCCEHSGRNQGRNGRKATPAHV
jgi:hypothetical protein